MASADLMPAAPERLWLLGSLGAALLLALPSAGNGLWADDWSHLAAARELPSAGVAPLGLFRFPQQPADVERLTGAGLYPWWTDRGLKLSFFRPLSSLLATLDYRFFGAAAAVPHLESIAWYLLLLGALAALLRRALPGSWGPALFLVSIDPSHAVTVGWLANRNALVASALAAWGLVAHLRWREERWRPGRALSLLGLALGLAGGEVALGVLGYLLAYELFAAPGSRVARARALLPALLLLAGYLVHYRWGGYGASGSGLYLDPSRSPLRFLAAAPERALALLGAATLALPADAWALGPGSRVALAGGGALALAIGGPWLRNLWPGLERRGLGWLLPGAALSLVPCLATFPASRMLLVPTLGLDAAIACALLAALRQRTERRWRVLAPALVLALGHLAGPLVAWPVSSIALRSWSLELDRVATSAEIDAAPLPAQRLVLLVAPDPVLAFHLPALRALRGLPLPAHYSVLSMARADHRIARTGPATLELELRHGEMMTTPFEALVRDADHPLRAGERLEAGGLRATVLEVGTRGPRRVCFDFDAPLDGAALQWLEWREGGLRRWRPPAIGESVEWRWEPGVMPL